MTFPSIHTFRTDAAPQAPAFYVDTGPDGEHIDAILAAGSVAVLKEIKETVEAAGEDAGITPAITGDLQHRIDIAQGEVEAEDGYEELDPVIIRGPEAQLVAKALHGVAKGQYPKIGLWQRLRARPLVRHMLKPNQIPVIDQIDPEYEGLIAQASELVSPPLVVNGRQLTDIPVIIPRPEDSRFDV